MMSPVMLVLMTTIVVVTASPRLHKSGLNCFSEQVGFRAYFLSDESLSKQTAILSQVACPPKGPAREPCSRVVDKYWPRIAAVIQDWFCDRPFNLCEGLNLDCQLCLDHLAYFSGLLTNENITMELVEHMQGPAYCHDEWEEHTANCEGNIERLLPVALRVLAKSIPYHGEGICQAAHGVCHGEPDNQQNDDAFCAYQAILESGEWTDATNVAMLKEILDDNFVFTADWLPEGLPNYDYTRITKDQVSEAFQQVKTMMELSGSKEGFLRIESHKISRGGPNGNDVDSGVWWMPANGWKGGYKTTASQGKIISNEVSADKDTLEMLLQYEEVLAGISQENEKNF